MIKIGFMAMPVKPMPENWRSKDHGSLLGACYYWDDAFCQSSFNLIVRNAF